MRDKIEEFVEQFSNVPRFAHNQNSDRVYYSGPDFGKEELVDAIDALMFGNWGSAGDKVKEFENGLSRYVNQQNGLMVNSGSSANLVAISAAKKYFGWDDGDHIILSVVGFPTTLNPIIQNNLKPTFIDIEYDTLNFDLDKIEEKICQKTRAIFVSPVLGSPPDIDRLVDIANRHNLVLLLDCCDSLGSKWNSKHLSEYFFLSTFSFYPSHHISTLQGGMVCSNDEDFMRIARSFATWGRACYCSGAENLLQHGICGKRFSKWLDCADHEIDHKYLFTEIGYNLTPLDIQGAIGVVQLNKLDHIHAQRRINKKEISDIFEGCGMTVFEELPPAEASWFGVPVMCDSFAIKSKLVTHLEKNWIQTRNYFAGNILMHPAYSELGDYRDYPEASKVLERVFFVGCSQTISEEKISRISKVVRSFND
jgi:CDP-6-deoxy-D-xylo-4-hexulose-3-dehydrase